ncbi:hypothetical protein COW36_21610 [bacterium (Candidatus Blackallbacteria) CG17_big_fil_post_rev_8_21_14_2_50_48_46]|uniref:Uncharacterized protein n=1 Tax=bacterium (Candidatus Blackallbacteria) CG17_big_fil_post_rev_8_21_14_2_50_48_46 TaxID=2014261 RepID=A0A2M7FZ66_9BACT|nr:MAG: hypothetical protein COW64_14910 [bacterium (Candidatus Blackallbacteria) CG18_big_fil_WC_8_21_14_2_50_49_26]PIW14637.1 MAG: hypothetical protein COW36_21610 [bacterium (Candidatus Blackallbacteria) CG17_big_fil_post_rev_8_21_14_2_50_48_46]PIW45688.1 MAG: hypothetical protein COW20_19440 [bacterium (Candidatus Blackallbacteria) CG13_big_fil_rev_8_21_14_2_50_49_14]
MTDTLQLEQNTLELQIALENLESLVGGPGFSRELQNVEGLMKHMRLPAEQSAPLQARLDALRSQQQAQRNEASQILRTEIEERLNNVVVPSNEEVMAATDFKALQSILQKAWQALEDSRLWLEMEGRRLSRMDRDACWQTLKTLRSQQYEARQSLQGRLLERANILVSEAAEVIENTSLREAREGFKAIQQELGGMPLKPVDRQRFRGEFDKLWNRLQERSKAHREERQQRQEEGIQRLEEALRKVEAFIERKEPEVQAQQERLEQTDWHEQDQIERRMGQDKEALEDARRRQGELQAKLEDARNRLNR